MRNKLAFIFFSVFIVLYFSIGCSLGRNDDDDPSSAQTAANVNFTGKVEFPASAGTQASIRAKVDFSKYRIYINGKQVTLNEDGTFSGNVEKADNDQYDIQVRFAGSGSAILRASASRETGTEDGDIKVDVKTTAESLAYEAYKAQSGKSGTTFDAFNTLVNEVDDKIDELSEKIAKALQSLSNIESEDFDLEEDETIKKDLEEVVDEAEKNEDKLITICHIPNGEPTKRITIQIASASLETHQNHGDTLGECPIGPVQFPLGIKTDDPLPVIIGKSITLLTWVGDSPSDASDAMQAEFVLQTTAGTLSVTEGQGNSLTTVFTAPATPQKVTITYTATVNGFSQTQTWEFSAIVDPLTGVGVFISFPEPGAEHPKYKPGESLKIICMFVEVSTVEATDINGTLTLITSHGTLSETTAEGSRLESVLTFPTEITSSPLTVLLTAQGTVNGINFPGTAELEVIQPDKPVATLAINEGAGYTNSRQVTLNLSGVVSDGSVQMSVDSGSYEALNLAKSHTLADSDGLQTVTINLKDDYAQVSDDISDSITLDRVAPAISNATATYVTDTSSKITWDTNESCNGRVEYGTSTSYGSSVDATSYTTAHAITLSSLAQGTTYYYRISSADQAGNNASQVTGSFISGGEVSLSNITAAPVGISSATLSFNTSHNNVSFTLYYKEPVTLQFPSGRAFSKAITTGAGTGARSVNVDSLLENTTYQYSIAYYDPVLEQNKKTASSTFATQAAGTGGVQGGS
ncbi:fibronectin type III domain-containing protein [Candidatus Riflebacteria bacterium]